MTKKLGEYIEKWHIKKSEWKGNQDLEVLGVSNIEGITTTAHKKSKDLSNYLVIEPDTFAFNPYRINVGSIGLTPKDTYGLVSPAYTVFKVKKGKMIPELLLDFLKSFDGLQQVNKYARGTVRKALRYNDLCKIEVNFPDYEEQKNILNKKLIVEDKNNELSSEIQTQKQLLTQLKQSILQEAIQGKLTEEWRTHHPELVSGSHSAENLLQRIKTEKAQLIADKKIKKEKPLPPITQEEIPFELPNGWVWCRLGDILELLSDYHANGSYKILKENVELFDEPDYAIMLRTTNFHRKNKKKYKYISKHAYNFLSKSKVFPGDLIMNKIADPGRVFFVDDRGQPMSLAMNLFLLRIMNDCNKKFVYNYLHINYDYIYSFAGGATTKTITKDAVKELLIPLPPFEEQKEIVKKVEELMQKCTALEEEITQSETNAQMLMQAVLKEAFES